MDRTIEYIYGIDNKIFLRFISSLAPQTRLGQIKSSEEIF